MKARDERVALMNEVCRWCLCAVSSIADVLKILGGIRMLKVSCYPTE